MMNLIARSIERPPSALSSTASESPGKTRQESLSPLSAQAEMYDRTRKPVVCRDTSHERHRFVEKAHSSSYSEWNIDITWSSQEWKSDELLDDRTGRTRLKHVSLVNTRTSFWKKKKITIERVIPVVRPQRGAPQHFVTEDDEAESDLSLGSRSFLHRVNDQVRKRQKQSSMDATEDSDKHSGSIMQEDHRESFSLTLRTRNSRKPVRMQEENWKHQWLQPCLARLARKTSVGKPVARLMISSLNLRVSWKPVNPQECEWKNLYQNIMRTILQEKGTIHYNITIWCTNLFLCLKQ